MNTPKLTPEAEQALELAQTGRPSRYIQHADEIDELVLRCGAAGYSYAQTAACVGVSSQTLRAWSANHPRFAEVLARAHTLSQAWWEGRAMDGTANNLIGGTIWSKSMSARFPHDYTERREEGPLGGAGRIREIEWNIVGTTKDTDKTEP